MVLSKIEHFMKASLRGDLVLVIKNGIDCKLFTTVSSMRKRPKALGCMFAWA